MRRGVRPGLLRQERKSPSHGFGAQVTSVMETGLADLVYVLDCSVRLGAWHRSGYQSDLWRSWLGVDQLRSLQTVAQSAGMGGPLGKEDARPQLVKLGESET